MVPVILFLLSLEGTHSEPIPPMYKIEAGMIHSLSALGSAGESRQGKVIAR